MKPLTLLLACLLSLHAAAGDTAKLEKYLVHNRYALTIEKDSSLTFNDETSQFIRNIMKGKNLFILGESALGHNWRLYFELRPALVRQFSTMNLKHFFIEFGRSTAWCFNLSTKDRQSYEAMTKLIWRGYNKELLEITEARKTGTSFSYVGIDFERINHFPFAVNNVLAGIDASKLSKSKKFIDRIRDTSYFNYSMKEFHKYYRSIRRDFQKNDAAIKRELGDKYEMLKYFCTNTNNTTPGSNRDRALSRNLLIELSTIDTNATYLLSMGGDHTLAKTSVVHKLLKHDAIKDRMVVMNVFYEDAFFAKPKGEVTRAFANAANGEIVIYDLSKLPEEFAEIKSYGDLLLYVRTDYGK